MSTKVLIGVDGPFSLAAAAAFGFGPNTGRPRPEEALMRLAFVTDDLRHQAGTVLSQQPGGELAAEISGPADAAAVAAQLRRILSVDRPAAGWIAAGRADPVLGRLQAAHPGLRPVLYHSPYEAAAWSVLSQRRQRSQATALRSRLSAAAGRTFELAGQQEAAFPLPEQLLATGSFAGIEPRRMERLHGVAAAALSGRLDPARLAVLDTAAAMAQLQEIPGLGPVYAGLVYLRSTGVADALTLAEPRLASYLQHYYRLPELPDAAAVQRIAERWRPFRTWAAVLIRAAGDRDGLPWQAATGRPRPRPARAAPGQ